MWSWSLILRLLALSGATVHAYPKGGAIAPTPTTPSKTSHHHISYKSPTPAPASAAKAHAGPKKAVSSPTKAYSPLGSAAYATQVSNALAENPGPGTSLDAVQQQANQQESAIAAQGASLHAAGVSSVSAGATSQVDCADGTWQTSVANWNKFNVDENLKTWWFGGKDTDGITYARVYHASTCRDAGADMEDSEESR